MLGDSRNLKSLTPDEIAALACQEFQAKRDTPTVFPLPGAGGYAASAQPPVAVMSAPDAAPSFSLASEGGGTLSREELLAGLAEEADAKKAAKGPMDAAEYRRRQEQALAPEGANAPAALVSEEQRTTPLSYDELLKKYYPHHAAAEEDSKAAAAEKRRQAAEAPLTPEELQRLEMMKAMERSQMPAVADVAGILAKTIEHYTFSDAEDSASFSVNLDKDLFDGASKWLQDASAQVRIDCRATSLEIRLQGIPVSQQKPTVMAEWKLTLSPLFARVEPSMTTHKVKGSKLTVKLAKSKLGAWKKGVKY